MKKKVSSDTVNSQAKRKRIAVIASCSAAAFAVVLVLAIVLPIVLAGRSGDGIESFRAPENKLSTEEKYALEKYDYENLSDVQVTLRADTMNVTKRGLPRPEVEMLSDDFSLTYNSDTKELKAVYGELVQSSGAIKAANISFKDYPSPSHGVSDNGAFATKFADGIASAGVSASDYFAYYKYMILTQGQHLAAEASRMSANGTLTQSWLKKHPAADAQYGRVLGENNAVEKEITLDPLYRSYHATGLYLPAGELVTVKVEGLGKGERVGITTGLQNSMAWAGGVNDAAFNEITGGLNQVKAVSSDPFFTKADVLTANGKFFDYNSGGNTPILQSQWKRQNNLAPWLQSSFTFNADGEYNIGSAFGGVIHINPFNCYSHAKITITGAVETPHYILGVTTPEYFDEYLRDAPGVLAVIDTENGQLIGPTGEMGTRSYLRVNTKDEIDKLAMLWHSFFSVNESFTGGTYNRNNLVKFDQHVPAGAAVALGGYVYACPTGWFNTASNYRSLLTGGQWGILHEIGHNHASSYGTFWGFGDGKEGEVHNNALTTLAYIMFCDIGTQRDQNGNIPAEHGFVAHPYSTLRDSINTSKKAYTDYSQNDYFEMLAMYANIMHSFGAEKFYELLYTYKASSAYLSNKRADFTYRCALIYGMDFRKYFNEFYKAKITDGMFVRTVDGAGNREYLQLIEGLPEYEPVASYYAGGIDGVKTGGDLRVAYGEQLTFDLLGKTITRLDTTDSKGFEIISVDSPEHGKLTDMGGGKYKYEFNKEYTGTFDKFSYYVKMRNEDATVHRLDVYLRISYNSSRVSVYSGVTNPGTSGAALFENLESTISQMTPTYTSAIRAGVNQYNSNGVGEVRIAEFRWIAPVTGQVAVTVIGDGALSMKAGESFDTLVDTGLVFSGGLAYKTANSKDNAGKFMHVMNVTEGKSYAFKVYSTTVREPKRNCDAWVGILQKSGKLIVEESLTPERVTEHFVAGARYEAISVSQIVNADLPETTSITPFVYEPQYMVSKKDNIKLSTTGTDKSEWSVVKAPTDIQDGRFYTTKLYDLDPESPTYNQVIKEIENDKWDYLIDGQTGTNLHTRWTGNVPKITEENPHEFIIDTSKQQGFNYFSVTTRDNVNSYITSFEMQISSDYDPVADKGTWVTVATGDRNSYSGTTVTKKFSQVEGRYLRLLVKGTTGGTFSVLAEFDAGIQSQTQKVIAPTSSKLYATKAWKNSSTLADEPNGYLVASKKNAKVVIRFSGERLALYAAIDKGYGKIKVKIDGKETTVADLDSEINESRKLVFYAENLESKEHTVEVITMNSGKVMLNVIGIPYTAQLLNAPNIYLEHNLTVALVVFVLLFAALLALVLCLTLIPKFRNIAFGNRFMKKYDEKSAIKSAKKAEIKAAEKARKQAEADKEKEKKLTPKEMVERNLKEKKEKNDTAATVTPAAKPAPAKPVRPAQPAPAAKPASPTVTARQAAAAPVRSAANAASEKSAKSTAAAPKTPRNDAAARAAEIAKRTPARPAPAKPAVPPAKRPTKK